MVSPEPTDPARLEELTRQALAAAEAGNFEAVGRTLAERRVRLRRLAADRADGATSRVLEVLEDMLRHDAQTETLVRGRLARLVEELRALGRGRRGLAGYGGRGPAVPSRIDERG